MGGVLYFAGFFGFVVVRWGFFILLGFVGRVFYGLFGRFIFIVYLFFVEFSKIGRLGLEGAFVFSYEVIL